MGAKQVFSSGLSDNNVTNSTLPLSGAKEQLGTIRYENNNVFKYVQFSGTTAVAVGDFVCYVVKGSDGNAQIVDKANTNNGAGLSMCVAASGAVSFGWIQIRGLGVCSTAFTTGADNNALTSVGATAGTVAVVAAVTNAPIGVAYDVAGKKIQLNCPF